MPLMQGNENLGKAFWAFQQANEVHIRLRGHASAEALYNTACCVSRAVEEQLRRVKGPQADLQAAMADLARVPATTSGVVAPELPMQGNAATLRGIIDSRLDLALDMLRRALSAGFARASHLRSDPDLRSVRELRASHFACLNTLQWQRKKEPAAAAPTSTRVGPARSCAGAACSSVRSSPLSGALLTVP